MNKKLEIRDTGRGDFDHLYYGDDILTSVVGIPHRQLVSDFVAMQGELELAMTILKRIRDDFHPPRQKEIADFIAKHETDEIPDKGDTMETNSKMKLEIRQDSDFTAMQSELETLRAKCKAFDWLEKHGEKFLTYIDENGQVVVCFSGTPYDEKGRAVTFQLAIEDFIAKHETDEIPDKGDTMNTKDDRFCKNCGTIIFPGTMQQKTDDGFLCHRCMMKTETDQPRKMKLEIRNVTEGIIALFFNGKRCSGDHHSNSTFGKTYLKLANYIASLESRLAELEELAENFRFIERNANKINMIRHSDGEYAVWLNPDTSVKDESRSKDFLQAVKNCRADYRDKHPEPEEDEAVALVDKLISVISTFPNWGECGNVVDALNEATAYLAREERE